jgi:flagellar protein FlbD
VVIALTRANGERCSLDPAHIQRVEGDPTTVVHLTDGAKYCVTETVDEVLGAVRRSRAEALTTAWRIVDAGSTPATADGRGVHAAGTVGGRAAGAGAVSPF